MDALEMLRKEYRQVGIGPGLEGLLAKIVWSTVRQYPPAEYSPYGTWDRFACEDVLNNWIAERLWGRADLQSLLSSSATLQHLRAGLTTSLRQYLANKCRRSIAANLFKRIRKMLRDDAAFRRVGSVSTGSEQWALVNDSAHVKPSESQADLIRAASELTDDQLQVVRYGPFSQKLSPILRDPKLREFLVHLFHRAGRSLTLGEIIDVMRRRFSLPTDETIELDESLPSLETSPADEAMSRLVARSVVSRLNLDENNILEHYFRSNGVFLDAAQRSGKTMQRVREVVYRALAMVCESSDSENEARTMVQNIEALLTQHGDR